jgi:uncharacterized protein YbcC (UPF0753/DUF2309 family)
MNELIPDSNEHTLDHIETRFDEEWVLQKIKHYLPAQAPLKDFVHHNTLHAFQHHSFFESLRRASKIFGYRVTLSLKEFRDKYDNGQISNEVLNRIIKEKKGGEQLEQLKKILLHKSYNTEVAARIGGLRAHWKSRFDFDIDVKVHPLFFRILCSYLDQGISIWDFPVEEKGFLSSIRQMERVSYSSFFSTKRAKELLKDATITIKDLLEIVVGDESLFEQYLFDQQFAHQGWSGMVAVIESLPSSLINSKKITLEDAIKLELLLEIDALDKHFGDAIWSPLGSGVKMKAVDVLTEVPSTELTDVIEIWQEAMEWTYYEQVLSGIKLKKSEKEHLNSNKKSFQALLCIDDRECSFRRYIEQLDQHAETFGTPGFFGVEFYFQPSGAKNKTKLCPAPVTPAFLIREKASKTQPEKDIFHHKYANTLVRGWLVSQALGFWAALKLAGAVLKPSENAMNTNAAKHMHDDSELTVFNSNNERAGELQIGFSIPQASDRMEALLKSIGLINHFADVVYIIGHGASSANNPHYSAYDCGACCGRPGSVNARVAAHMLNNKEVRNELSKRGIVIPDHTQFVGALHDTTRDAIYYYDFHLLNEKNKIQHSNNNQIFNKALDLNARERSRRLESINSDRAPEKIHQDIIKRSVSLFEPRPELNHATNTLCIVGRRNLSDHLFLDRRSFMNSYDYHIDPDGKYLFGILKAVAPVCGGINLEYFFSRVDKQKLGAGSKLPHNVMGLIGVANGYDGDLRPGLPVQMTEMHDPLRLLVIVEHFPDVVLKTIQSNDATYEWFKNEWINLVAVHPETNEQFLFKNELFQPIGELALFPLYSKNIDELIVSTNENLPVYIIK